MSYLTYGLEDGNTIQPFLLLFFVTVDTGRLEFIFRKIYQHLAN